MTFPLRSFSNSAHFSLDKRPRYLIPKCSVPARDRLFTARISNIQSTRQLLGEGILLVGSISLGLVAYLVADIRQRRAFLDTRQSFEMRLTIESQAREQVND